MSHHRPCSSCTNREDRFTVLTRQRPPHLAQAAVLSNPHTPALHSPVPPNRNGPPLRLSQRVASSSIKREQEGSRAHTHVRLGPMRGQVAPTATLSKIRSAALEQLQERDVSALISPKRRDAPTMASASAEQQAVPDALSHHTFPVFVSSNAQSSPPGSPRSFSPTTYLATSTPLAPREPSRLTTPTNIFPIVFRRNTLLVRSVSPSVLMDTSTPASYTYSSTNDTLTSTGEPSSTPSASIEETLSTFSTSIPAPFETTSVGFLTDDSWNPGPTMGYTSVSSFGATSSSGSATESSSTLEPSISPTTESTLIVTTTDAPQVPESVSPSAASSSSPTESTTLFSEASDRESSSTPTVTSTLIPRESSSLDVVLTPTLSEPPIFIPLSTSRAAPSLSLSLETFTSSVSAPVTPSGSILGEDSVTTVVESSETTVTVTSTIISISTQSDLFVTTVTSAAETGILQTPSLGLSDSIETIIGASVGGGGSLILAIIAVWFFIRKYQRKHANSDEEAVVPAWKSPLRDETDDKPAGLSPFVFSDRITGRKLSTRTAVDDGEYNLRDEGLKKSDSEDAQRLGTVDGHTEAGGAHQDFKMDKPRHTPESSTAHDHEDLGRTLDDDGNHGIDEDLVEIPLFKDGPSHTGLSDPQLYHLTNPASFMGDSVATVKDNGHASLFFGSVATAATRASTLYRASLPGPPPDLVSQRTTRNFSAPVDNIAPSFPLGATSGGDVEEAKPRGQERGNYRGIFRGWLDRWAGRGFVFQGSEAKTESTSDDLRIPNPFKRSMDSLDDSPLTIPSPIHTPLVSASVARSSPPLLSFPRGVTGKGYTANAAVSSQPVLIHPPSISAGHFTAPPPPSPTDSGSVVKVGLLHPRLSTMNECARQPSLASFNDHEDYSRPIGATALDRENSLASSSKT